MKNRTSTETTRNIHVVLIDDEVATFALLTLGEGATLGQKLQAEYGARRVYIVTASHLPMGLAETLDAVRSSQRDV